MRDALLFYVKAVGEMETENLTECRTMYFLTENKVAGQKNSVQTRTPVRMKQGHRGGMRV